MTDEVEVLVLGRPVVHPVPEVHVRDQELVVETEGLSVPVLVGVEAAVREVVLQSLIAVVPVVEEEEVVTGPMGVVEVKESVVTLTEVVVPEEAEVVHTQSLQVPVQVRPLPVLETHLPGISG